MINFQIYPFPKCQYCQLGLEASRRPGSWCARNGYSYHSRLRAGVSPWPDRRRYYEWERFNQRLQSGGTQHRIPIFDRRRMLGGLSIFATWV